MLRGVITRRQVELVECDRMLFKWSIKLLEPMDSYERLVCFYCFVLTLSLTILFSFWLSMILWNFVMLIITLWFCLSSQGLLMTLKLWLCLYKFIPLDGARALWASLPIIWLQRPWWMVVGGCFVSSSSSRSNGVGRDSCNILGSFFSIFIGKACVFG